MTCKTINSFAPFIDNKINDVLDLPVGIKRFGG